MAISSSLLYEFHNLKGFLLVTKHLQQNRLPLCLLNECRMARDILWKVTRGSIMKCFPGVSILPSDV